VTFPNKHRKRARMRRRVSRSQRRAFFSPHILRISTERIEKMARAFADCESSLAKYINSLWAPRELFGLD
jgi:hypothetical protein